MKVGQRVKFQNGERECTGTIVKTYPGYFYSDEDGRYWIDTHHTVVIDETPKWWPYGDMNKFAPAETDLTLIQE